MPGVFPDPSWLLRAVPVGPSRARAPGLLSKVGSPSALGQGRDFGQPSRSGNRIHPQMVPVKRDLWRSKWDSDSPEMVKPPGTCASGSCHPLRLKRCSRERCEPEPPGREHGQELRSWGRGERARKRPHPLLPPSSPPATAASRPLTPNRNPGANEPSGSAPKAQRAGTGREAEITGPGPSGENRKWPHGAGVAPCVALPLPRPLRAPSRVSGFRSDAPDTSGGSSCPGGRGAGFHPTRPRSHLRREQGLFLSVSQTQECQGVPCV